LGNAQRSVTWSLSLPRDETMGVKRARVFPIIGINQDLNSPGQLCASSRGKTEGASVIYDDWA